jgi:hypothetical protein
MKIIRKNNYLEGRVVRVELTRRNLLTLLVKLDDPSSAHTLEMDGVRVKAVEDVEHYAAEGASIT